MLRTFALVTMAGFASVGAAQATPLETTDSRQVTMADPANKQVAEAIIIEQRARTQANEVRSPKVRIWVSMGF
jgi:hypothetical protein